MTLYLIVFFALWGVFYISAVKGDIVVPFEYLALAIFIIFAGQRFETGNDWLTYRDHYLALQQFGFSGGDSPQFPAFEPLYVLTVWLSGHLFDFQTFLFIVAVFNGLILFWFAKVWGASFCGLAAIYYAWVYLATQMATTRYSLAMSFILLALICLAQSRRALAYALILVAAGFHFFSLAFIPIVLLIGRRLSFRLAILTLVIGFVFVHLVLLAVSSGALDSLPFSEKIVFYLDQATVKQISFGSVGYIGLNLAFFYWIMKGEGVLIEDNKMLLVKWSMFYLLFFQVVVWMLPVFWNRVQIFVIVIQACVLSKYMVDRRNVLFLLASAAISLAAFTKFLADPAFISYIPYQSYWVDKVLTDSAREDGTLRFMEAIDQNKLRAH
ncbi:EpsG family protein [Paraburkholderia silvatlantica]|uniref:EpsG family protein n=1 Tax=Paraburkholderia silvatlantica TaxID=321895 RepID=UPI003752BE2C